MAGVLSIAPAVCCLARGICISGNCSEYRSSQLFIVVQLPMAILVSNQWHATQKARGDPLYLVPPVRDLPIVVLISMLRLTDRTGDAIHSARTLAGLIAPHPAPRTTAGPPVCFSAVDLFLADQDLS